MYDTGGSYSVCQLASPDDYVARRLNWLRFETAPLTERRRLALEAEERRTLSMLQPLSTEEAYRWFGTFLGLFPPFALFTRFIGDQASRDFTASRDLLYYALLCLAMNAVCCLVGRKFGGFLGRKVGDPRSRPWLQFAFCPVFMALLWGLVTGGLGGAVFFGIGAIFGALVAINVALVAFPVFAILHRLISRGGMIEARHTWPLAFGIPLTIAALISSPWLK